MTDLKSQLVSEWIKIHWHIDITKIFFIHTGSIIDMFACLFEIFLIILILTIIAIWIYGKINNHKLNNLKDKENE
jgi:hypothetical protein